MTDDVSDPETVGQANLGAYSSIAFGRIFPRRYVVFSAIVSVCLGWSLGVGGLVYFGFVESLTQPDLLDSLTGMLPFVTFASGITVGITVSAFLFFGLLAPTDIRSHRDVITRPATYTFVFVITMAFVTLAFGFVLGLSYLSGALAFVAAFLIFLVRYLTETFWTALGNTPGRVTLISRLFLLLSLLAWFGLYFFGYFPEWSLGEWAIAFIYGLIGYMAIGGPVSFTQNLVEQEVRGVAAVISYVSWASDQQRNLRAMAPEGIPVDLDIPQEPMSFSEAYTIMQGLEDVDPNQWFEAYYTYIAACNALEQLLGQSLQAAKASGDPDSVDSTIATVATNLHPQYYDKGENAIEAASVLASIVDRHENDPVANVSELGSEAERETLFSITGPGSVEIEQIASLFETTVTPSPQFEDRMLNE